MDVTFESRIPCIICGYRMRVLRCATARINKRSMRAKTYLAWVPRWCDECGAKNLDDLVREVVTLHPDSQAKIAAYRLKRWPELAEEGLTA